MAIPEHSKCVKSHKQIRRSKQNGNWRKIRAIRRKNGEIKLKMRIRQILKIEFEMERAKTRKIYGMRYTECMKYVIGKHYRRWGEV